MDDKNRKHRRTQAILNYVTLPFVLSVPPIIGWYIGSWLDRYFEIAPYCMYIFLVLGFVAGVREFYRIVTKYKDEEM